MLIITISFIFLIAGCSGKPKPLFCDNLLDMLVDTVYAGEKREVLLTDLTGGFYFDGAFRDQERGEYGFSFGERKLLAGWEILDMDGNRIDDEPDFCVVYPDLIERHYLSGVIEKVECPPSRTGILLCIYPGRRKGIIFRPLFDFRRLDREENPHYKSRQHEETNSLVIYRTDQTGGWLAATVHPDDRITAADSTFLLEHHYGELIGRSAFSHAYTTGDYHHKSQKPFMIGFGWGDSLKGAVLTSRDILLSATDWRAERQRWMKDVLTAFNFRCENHTLEKTFAWARLTLAGMLVQKKGEKFLITGIPYSPWPDGWFTCFSSGGIAAMEGDPQTSFELLDAIIARQNMDTLSSKYGMLPGKMNEDGPEYRVPEIAGLATMAYRGLTERITWEDTTRSDSLAVMLARDLVGTVKYRLHQGLVVNAANEHFLWDSPAAPDRKGATLETQILFGEVREFLKRYNRLDQIADIPPSLLLTRGSWKAGISDDTERPMGYTATDAGDFIIPLPVGAAGFYDATGRRWADRLVYHQVGNKSIVLPPEMDSTRYVSIPISIIWDKLRGRDHASGILTDFTKAGYIAEAGLRSLAESAVDYQADHLYQLDEAPYGTTSRGDVLLWTSWELAELYRRTERWDRMLNLVEALSQRVLSAGVIGGLPEAESGQVAGSTDNSVGSPVHSTSLACFIRIVAENIIGIKPARSNYVRVIPRVPDEWGNYRIESSFSGGSFSVERCSDGVWIVSQHGIEPNLSIGLNLSGTLGKSARHSLKLDPGDMVKVRFFLTDDKRWKCEVKNL